MFTPRGKRHPWGQIHVVKNQTQGWEIKVQALLLQYLQFFCYHTKLKYFCTLGRHFGRIVSVSNVFLKVAKQSTESLLARKVVGSFEPKFPPCLFMQSLVLPFSPPYSPQNQKIDVKKIAKGGWVLHSVMKTPEPGLPDGLFSNTNLGKF
jgi:hypothetical protein